MKNNHFEEIIGIISMIFLPAAVVFIIDFGVDNIVKFIKSIIKLDIDFWAVIVAIIVPIYIMFSQRREERNKAVLPILSVVHYNGLVSNVNYDYSVDYVKSGKYDSHYCLNDPQHENVKMEVTDTTQFFCTEILVKNIGKGPVLSLCLDINGKTYMKDRKKLCLGEKETIRYNLFIEGNRLKCSANENNQLVLNFTNTYGTKYRQTIEFGVDHTQFYSLTNFWDLTNLIEGWDVNRALEK